MHIYELNGWCNSIGGETNYFESLYLTHINEYSLSEFKAICKSAIDKLYKKVYETTDINDLKEIMIKDFGFKDLCIIQEYRFDSIDHE